MKRLKLTRYYSKRGYMGNEAIIKNAQPSEYRSNDINLIMAALATAQGEYKPLVPNQPSAHGYFANLEAILKSTRVALSANGLAFYQYLDLDTDGILTLISTLGHSSGQWISSKSRIVTGNKTDKQLSNTLEINKRMSAMMLLGVAPSVNDPDAVDDDGQEQQEEATLKVLKTPKAKTLDYNETVSKEQYNDLLIELEDYEEIASQILETYDIPTLADLPKTEYQPVLRQIRKLIKRHEEYMRARS